MSRIIIMSPVLLIMIAIPLLIGVYVYKDAKKRGMNAVLWVLIALLAPSMIGFIVYLLVRGNYSNMRCGKCNEAVTEHYVVCPNCGAKLKASCPNCAEPVEAGWIVCPKCTQPLPEYQDDIVTPVRPKDNALWKILLIVILIPIFMIILLIVMFSFNTASGGGISTSEIPIEIYLQDVDEPRVEKWLESCDKESGKAYVLEYRIENEHSKQVSYLIYMPELAEQFNFVPNTIMGLFEDTLELEFVNVNDEEGDVVNLVTYDGDSYPELEIFLNGENVDCEITPVDYSLEPTDYID